MDNDFVDFFKKILPDIDISLLIDKENNKLTVLGAFVVAYSVICILDNYRKEIKNDE